jgi:hypothetical protein
MLGNTTAKIEYDEQFFNDEVMNKNINKILRQKEMIIINQN